MTHEPNQLVRHSGRFLVLFIAMTFLVSLPLAAQEADREDSDPPKRHRVINIESLGDLEALEGLRGLEGLAGLEGLRGLEGLAGLEGLQALRLIGCEEGEDCPSYFSLGARGGFLGVQTSSMTEELRAHFGAPAHTGALVSRVVEDSPAGRAGIQAGDIITEVNGKRVQGGGHLGSLIRKIEAETPADIEIIRDHRAMVLTATIQEHKRATIELSHVIDQSVAGALQAFDPSVISDALAGIDFRGITNLSVGALDEAELEEALDAISRTFDSDAWQGYVSKLENLDFSELEARMEALQERMEKLGEELERKREERHRR